MSPRSSSRGSLGSEKQRKRLLLPLAVALTATTLSLVTTSSAPAAADETYADQIIDSVRASTPDEAPSASEIPLAISSEATGFASESQDIGFTLPDTANEPVRLASSDSSLTVELPNVQVSTGVLTSDSDAIVFPDNGSATAVAIQAFDEGAQVSTILASASSPGSFDYEVTIPSGGTVTLLEEGGVAVTDATGLAVGYMSPPWARDASGAEVPTHFVVQGNVVTQVVQHQGSVGYQYPIVADPFLGKNLISGAKWKLEPRSQGGAIGRGWTLQVTPTKWAVALTGSYYVGTLGWKELYSKWKNTGLNRNLDTMRDQWICHQQFKHFRKPLSFNETWNLDEWRLDVSYRETVLKLCNPPRGGDYVYD